MKSNRRALEGGFTLAEVLAALLVMALLVPVALEGMSVLARTSELGWRKVQAMRIADRILGEELAATGQGTVIPTSDSGMETTPDGNFPWTMTTDQWPVDAMTQMTVQVSFTLRGATYQVRASTLYDPNAATLGNNSGSASSSAQ